MGNDSMQPRKKQAWFPKTWTTARCNQEKIASPQEEAERAQHHNLSFKAAKQA
jgi:hypothetical protein